MWNRNSLTLIVLVSILSRTLCEVAPVDPEKENHRRGGPSSPVKGPASIDVSGEEAKVGSVGIEAGVFKDGDGDEVRIKEDKANSGFVNGFIATLSVIVVSELGDKTFFIAAIMAMRHARMTVFTGAMAALATMHVMSAFFGYAITVIPRLYTYYLSSFLFAVFGIKMLKEGYQMKPEDAKEEFDEVQEDLKRREGEPGGDPEAGIIGSPTNNRRFYNPLYRFVSRIFLQAFTMTFLAEWGDRSQLATIVLAAREDLDAVIIGGILGHGLCTGLAVLGGRMIAQRISVRTVTLVGGVVFIMFALTALFMDPNAA